MKGFVCMISFLVVLLREVQVVRSGNPLATAFFVFGDSLSDAGNNNLLKTEARVNYKPYGIDFPSGPTGRFSNGKNFPDFTAEMLGLPSPPAYLTVSQEERKKIKTGMNYASGGAGLLDDTGKQLGEYLSFKQQVNYFEKTVTEDMPCQFQNQQALLDHLANSIFFINMGSNDLLTNYRVSHPSLKDGPDLAAFIQSMINSLSNGVKKLYGLGARKFLMFDIGALGCSAAFTSTLTDPSQCSAEMNGLAIAFNEKMGPVRKQLESELSQACFIYGDSFSINVAMHVKPESYGTDKTNIISTGFQYAREPCCKAAMTIAGTCPPNAEPCTERSKYMFWDYFHPTEALSAFLANQCFSKATLCNPINLQQLAMRQVTSAAAS